MAMRITTKMMQTRSLNNLNTNKSLQQKLTTQLATGKKVTRPSDDPIVAIRSLKLNASLNKVDQYYEKNAKDAESWLKLTESALKTTNNILEGMRTYVVQASNGPLEAKDRRAIVENLSNFRTEIYSTGNADSAGRTIFTGYRTNTPLTVQEDTLDWTKLTEQITNAKIDTTTFVKTGVLSEINEGNFMGKDTTEFDVDSYKIPRIRLAYQNLDYDQTKIAPDIPANVDFSFRVDTELSRDGNGTLGSEISTTNYKVFVESDAGDATGRTTKLTIYDLDGNEVAKVSFDPEGTKDANGNYPITVESGTIPDDLDVNLTSDDSADPVKYSVVFSEYPNDTDKAAGLAAYKTTSYDFSVDENADGTFSNKFESFFETKLTVTDYFRTATDDAYLAAVGDANANNVVYIAETGELLLGANIQKQLAALPPSAEIRATYEKTDWKRNDLDPVHYYYAERIDKDTGKLLIYNEDKLTDKTSDNARQIINYDIGSNQSIRVNTLASEVFNHDIGRDIDEVLAMLDKYEQILTVQDNVDKLIKSDKYLGEELEKLNLHKDGLKKAADQLKDKIQKSCQGMITNFDGYIKQATLATTDVGSRESRLILVQNRLGEQQTNFQELVSENEDADITELAIQLSSVELTYQAALSSISYVMKTSLLDFI